MRKTHELKILPIYYDAVREGRKTFEVRKDDRDFKNDDTVILREWEPELEIYSGREMKFTIGYVLPLNIFLSGEPYVAFSLLETFE